MKRKNKHYYDYTRNMSEEQIEEFNQDSLNMVFCGTGSCKCPAINIHKDLDNVIIGGKDEGFTVFTKEQFKLFVKEIKEGTFDPYISTS